MQIHKFFRDTRLTLAGMSPDDAIAGGDPFQWKCIRNHNTLIVYVANPQGDEPSWQNPAEKPASVALTLPQGIYSVRWFHPKTGTWLDSADIPGGLQQFQTPLGLPGLASGDRVLLLRLQSSGNH
ncbi:MAG: hypothetical protein KIT83_05325 [Bryobacterales bacterium]|nr:hypothetical protein [Bryobacterales bacterium]